MVQSVVLCACACYKYTDMNKVMLFYPKHDANLTIIEGDEIIAYFEFEKITNKRYFAFSTDEVTFMSEVHEFMLPHIKVLEITTICTNWMEPSQIKVLKKIFKNVKKWYSYPHHLSHVWSAYSFTRPRESDLILSFDGGGDMDDYFYIYSYRSNGIRKLLEVKVNLGKPYRLLGLLSPDLYEAHDGEYDMGLPLSGKKMSLLAHGHVEDMYIKPLERFYYDFMLHYDQKTDSVEENFRMLLDDIGLQGERFISNRKTALDVLATSQYVFEKMVFRYIEPFIEEEIYDRLIIVGGCALNVVLNSKIEKKYNIEVFIPPCPSDCGISIGMAKICNPGIQYLSTAYSDVPPSENGDVKTQLSKYSTHKRISIKELAKLLAEGMVVGTMVGPIEIGPRALGNRSYLASPFVHGMKNRINSKNMKDRESWRPVAPIISLEKLSEYFDTTNPSPYMTFAPKIRDNHRALLKEVMHIDGSARIQTVDKGDGWIYRLIKEFAKITGHPILMNTSFNKQGSPLVNDYAEAELLFRSSGLDALIIAPEGPETVSERIIDLYLKV